MAAQYFIKRGKTVKGPFSVEKLQALKKAKKLKADDGVSQSAEGPWESLAAHEKAKQSSEQPNPSPAKPSPKTVACEDCGGIVSKRAHQCPNCGSPIGQSEDQVPSAVAEDTDDEQFGAYYDDEVAYEDDDGYEDEPAPRRKRSKAKGSTSSSKGRKKKASSADKPKGTRLAYKIIGGIIAFYLACAVIILLQENGLPEWLGGDSAEFKRISQELEEAKKSTDSALEAAGRQVLGNEEYEERVIRDAEYERAKRELNR